jgi:hypothetical protein
VLFSSFFVKDTVMGRRNVPFPVPNAAGDAGFVESEVLGYKLVGYKLFAYGYHLEFFWNHDSISKSIEGKSAPDTRFIIHSMKSFNHTLPNVPSYCFSAGVTPLSRK